MPTIKGKMKLNPWPGKLLRTLPLMMLLAGCAVHQRMDNGKRLIARPDFPQAATNAPAWTKEALHTISALEYEIERR